MLHEIKYFFQHLKQIRFSQIVSLFLGLILISAAPYSLGLGHNWFVPLAEGYRISFFYVAEIVIYSVGFFVFGFQLKNKTEKLLFLAIIAIILSRIISLVFSLKFQSVQVISILRYVEVFLCVYILTNLLAKKDNRTAFIIGLAVGVFLESVIGFLKLVLTSGELRGIFMGTPSYQLQILFVLTLILLAASEKKWILIFFISLITMGIICTQTRSALMQLGMGIVLVIVWGIRKKIFRVMFPVIAFSILVTGIVCFLFKSTIIDSMSKRVTEAIGEAGGAESGGTTQYRLYLWDKALGAFLSHPVTGIGSGGFGRQIAELPQVFNIPIQSERKNQRISAHSTVFSIMAETGIIGLLAYLLWAVALMKIVLRIFRHYSTDSFAIASAMMTIIFLLSDPWSENSFQPNASFILAFMLGCIRENNQK